MDLDTIYKDYQIDPVFEHLRKLGANFVPGEGTLYRPTYMFIGEAPGRHEDKQKRPFVGPSGKLLRNYLQEYDIRSYFLTNVLKYRPPNNRQPVSDERIAGQEYLLLEIASVQPQLVVLLGGTAVRTILGAGPTISRVHGQLFHNKYFAMYHPAAAIYDESKQAILHEDFSNLVKLGTSIDGQPSTGA